MLTKVIKREYISHFTYTRIIKYTLIYALINAFNQPIMLTYTESKL
jgi:hypothetical protein